jgi:hypothetical protein
MVEVGRLRDVRAVRWSAHPDGALIDHLTDGAAIISEL